MSKPPPCTPEQMAELCMLGCKEMEILCVRDAMAKKEEVVVKAPDAVSKFRNNANKLREAALWANGHIEELCGSDKAQNMVGDQEKNGMIGSMVGFMAQAADAVVGMVGATAGAIVEKSLNGMASGIDSAVDAIEDPFTKVGKDILAAKEEELLKVYAEYINKYKFDNPTQLVRGEEPYGPEQYQACPGDSISKALSDASVEALAAELLPIVQPAINEHSVTKAWNSCLHKTKAAHDKISEYKDLETFGIEKPDLDINIYIVTETIVGLGELMAKAEAENRASPAGKSRIPATFEVVFSGTPLHKGHYSSRDK